MYGMKKNELRLLPHDPVWKDDFIAEKNRITTVLQNSTIQIEHVGSTSIPTIHAKPILDISILCNEKTIESVIRTLVELGYNYRGAFGDEIGHFYAVLDKDDVRLCQVHINTEPGSDWCCKLHFRDVLRQNHELAREYNDYKLELAKLAFNKSEYAKIKTHWMNEFIKKVVRVSIDA
jgi:GrpB-like predicted nucleotidyltransferase (UPF0157 family)